jgi:outer membrane protein assembly factor BamB
MVVAPIEWEPVREEKELEAGRLEKGPAFGKVPSDGKELTFTVKEEQHLVEAHGAGSKEVLWTFTAAGRIDTPPVVCQGVALLGARDGYVYALRASDGALVWRFRAAPRERRMVAYGQLESAWPIVGGVLVADGVAYVIAGTHSEFAGGVTVYAMKPDDGTVVWKQRFVGTGGTSSRGGPTWGDVVVTAKPVIDGGRLIIPGTKNLPGKRGEARPIDGLGGKIMDLKTGKVEQPVGAKFSKALNPTTTYTFDGQMKIWKGMKPEVKDDKSSSK